MSCIFMSVNFMSVIFSAPIASLHENRIAPNDWRRFVVDFSRAAVVCSNNDDATIIAVVEIKGAAAADGFVNYAFLSAA